ncbi:MAG: TrkH family potassium uptake protein, partial [Bacillota bacterium]
IKGLLNVISNILFLISFFMIFPLIIAILYNEKEIFVFIFCSGITFLFASVFKLFSTPNQYFTYKDGYITVFSSWLMASLFSAIPFYLSGLFNSPLNAFFESVSGLTTTGATAINSLEYISYSILFWRSFIHWIGGMGIIAMVIVLMPELTGNIHLYNRENTGFFENRIKATIKDTASLILFIYGIFTLIEIILLFYFGMPLFDSIIHSFGTISTGGFSLSPFSIKIYNSLKLEIIVIIFMFLSGINFSLYYAFKNKKNTFFKNEELQFYIIIIIIFTLAITINLNFEIYKNIFESFRYALFQVISVITTTGYATINFDLWPSFSRWLLLILMVIGGCAGSTAGGIKIIRIIILFKTVKNEMKKLLHPGISNNITINNEIISSDLTKNTLIFFFLYFFIICIAIILLTVTGLDLISALSATVSCLGNVGPGLKLIGPLNSFASLTPFARIVLIVCMFLGRLELYTVLVFIFIDWH